MSLAEELHRRAFTHLVTQAELIRDWPESVERTDQAVQRIREAMHLRAIGRLTQPEQSQLFSLLDFAMPMADEDVDEVTTPQQSLPGAIGKPTADSAGNPGCY